MELNIKNARWTKEDTIDVEIEHPVYGWMPFHATPHDPEPHGRAIFEALKDSDAVAPADTE